ncbi:RsmB/NOP family class I SAM-dependent RNA methyltransferase [Nocardioides sp. AX2bis]|uniref:RsmB/NOP family class I SAM-dependent RNA methyltransferase n=1 Tax=Nocardioides sp. AX2bis TaxID=2653157 RepID=UPI0012F352FE|nr:transcription antitermination factor NusB [Nocardioides sp. AX2bis]VXB68888.1 Ribosomal RNA small subunit methyltransferase B [Nocardioides sp. AX2bis]
MAEPRRTGPRRPGAARTGAPSARPPARTTAASRVDPARLAAFEVLKAVRVDNAYANLVLPAVLGRLGLEGRDAAFATELASGTLRLRGTYDAVLAACVQRPLRKVEDKVLDALRLGTHQLLSMRVPPHAAISTTVDLVRDRASSGAASFANAVLHGVTAHDLDGWVATLAPPATPRSSRYEEIAFSHPRWIVDELRRALGDEELHDLLRADNVAPRVTLVARPGLATREELPGDPTPWSPYGVVLTSGAPSAVPAVAEGRAGVQDEGSQLVAHVLAAAPVEGRDRTWVDLCAGPGGKAALLTSLAAGREARVVAVERQEHRARLVARSLAPTRAAGASYAVLAADGTRPPLMPGSVDRVLVDAPCTGLGALRRRPESRWRRRPDDVLPLVLLQRRLLGSALDLLRPGGVAVYATCSPVLTETDEVVAAVSQRPDVVVEDLLPLLPAGMPDAAGRLPGTAQLWPHRHGTDAMFLALLRKV